MTVARHTAYNMAGAAIPLAVSLLTVPAYLAAVGDARFGILAIVWLLLGYFGIFDLGLGLATSHHIAAAENHQQRQSERAQLFWSALLTNLGLGTLGGLLLLPVGYYYFAHVIEVDASLRREMLQSVPWLALGVPMATVTGVLSGALQGLRRFGPLNAISASGTILFQVLPLLAALLWSPSLTVVLPVALLSRAATLAMLWEAIRRLLTVGHRPAYSRERAIKLLKFGSWLTLSAFFAPLMAVIDRFAIGAAIGAAAIAIYAIPLNLGERLAIIGNSTAFAAIPEFSSSSLEEARVKSVRYEKVVMAVMVLLCVTAIFAIGEFLKVWINAEFAAKASLVAQVLLIGIWADSVSRVTLYANRGTGKNMHVAIIDMLQLPIVTGAIFLGIHYIGVLGVAFAYVFRVYVNYLLLAGLLRTIPKIVAPTVACVSVMIFSLILANAVDLLSVQGVFALFACWAVTGVITYLIVPTPILMNYLGRLPLFGAK
jgi:O-antigen/teichoic acid export membrane protein